MNTSMKPDIELLGIVDDANVILGVSCDGPGFSVANADAPSNRHHFHAGEWSPDAPAIDPDVIASLVDRAGEIEELLRRAGAWDCGFQIGFSTEELDTIY